MESKFAYDIVHLIDSNMKALKKVLFGSGKRDLRVLLLLFELDV